MTPRRRTAEHGVGVSPVAKRPEAYVVPDAANGPTMTIEQLTHEMYTQKNAITAMHQWVGSIYNCSMDHATQIEGAAKSLGELHGKLVGLGGKR